MRTETTLLLARMGDAERNARRLAGEISFLRFNTLRAVLMAPSDKLASQELERAEDEFETLQEKYRA
jgi:hypothetical protein